MAYTDDTILTSGKYKFTKLCRVPPDYLLDIYKHKSCPNKELIEYIKDNLQKIMHRKSGKIVAPELKRICGKMSFLSEKDAKFKINKIRDVEQEDKKPIRAYECEKCGGWHLTSIPYEQWEKKKI